MVSLKVDKWRDEKGETIFSVVPKRPYIAVDVAACDGLNHDIREEARRMQEVHLSGVGVQIYDLQIEAEFEVKLKRTDASKRKLPTATAASPAKRTKTAGDTSPGDPPVDIINFVTCTGWRPDKELKKLCAEKGIAILEHCVVKKHGGKSIQGKMTLVTGPQSQCGDKKLAWASKHGWPRMTLEEFRAKLKAS